MSIDQAFNFRRVSDTIGTAGLLSEDQLGALKQEGYESVINLLPDDSEYAIKGEKELIERQGLIYTHIPVDFSAPQTSDYRAFETAMNGLCGKKLIIHCAANYRVSAFYGIYAHHYHDWSVVRANEFIASVWNPGEHEPWAAFISSLMRLG